MYVYIYMDGVYQSNICFSFFKSNWTDWKDVMSQDCLVNFKYANEFEGGTKGCEMRGRKKKQRPN